MLKHGPLIVVVILAGSCRRSSPARDATDPSAPQFRCTEDWPVAAAEPALRPSLSGVRPGVRWRKRLPGSQAAPGIEQNGGVLLAGGHLAVAVGTSVFLLDGQGNQVAGPLKSDREGELVSHPVADSSGNVYFATLSGAYAADAAGRRRWSLPYGASTAEVEFYQVPPFVMSPDGVLYGVGPDQVMRALRASDGQVLWSRRVTGSVQAPGGLAKALGGAGGTLFVMEERGIGVYERQTGAALGQLRSSKGQDLLAYVGLWALGHELGIALGSNFVFDPCGRQKWGTWKSNLEEMRSGVIAAGERLVSVAWTGDRLGNRLTPDALSLYRSDGVVLVGPRPGEGAPYVAGADGTIYTLACPIARNDPPDRLRLVAYSPDLIELWRISLGGARDRCPVGMASLEDDGTLFVAHGTMEGDTEVLAIQTTSPGLAGSSWPSVRHDNRGTAWLTP
jgi:outer membrane protein assembly factor BamB